MAEIERSNIAQSDRFERQAEHLRKIHECDRRLLAYDFHDGFVQELIAARLTLESMLAGDPGSPNLRDDLGQVYQLVASALAESRRLLNRQHAAFRDEKLTELIRNFAANLPNQSRVTINLELDSNIDRLQKDLQTNLLRIIQQAVYNSLLHSDAINISVRATQSEADVDVEILDDGKGFHQDNERIGIGLESMQERTLMFGGAFYLDSEPGKGTSVRVVFPLTGTPEPI